MSRDKQIEEIVQDVDKAIRANFAWDVLAGGYIVSSADNIAQELYYKGYQKSTDLAEEIFAETHNMLVKVMRAVDYGLTKAILTDNEQAKLVHAGTKETLRCVILALAELKKKYTESEKENEKV